MSEQFGATLATPRRKLRSDRTLPGILSLLTNEILQINVHKLPWPPATYETSRHNLTDTLKEKIAQ
jgi:hypothetical protein